MVNDFLMVKCGDVFDECLGRFAYNIVNHVF